MSWFNLRFVRDERKTHVACHFCGRSMWLPASKAALYKTCGGDCAIGLRAAVKRAREKECETCGAVFVPRTAQLEAGHGRYCSQKCNPSHKVLNLPETQARAVANRAEAIRTGRVVLPSGEAHHSWRGGPEASKQRLVDSGLRAERVRLYRAKNPHKIHEFSKRRNGRKIGRLPRGTVKAIGEMQRWRCAVCRTTIKNGYHVDHIMPLAKGGAHEPKNIQLLCPPCNLRKSAKHPIDYMQERGFLL